MLRLSSSSASTEMFRVLSTDYEGSEICKGVGETGNKITRIFFTILALEIQKVQLVSKWTHFGKKRFL